jgi:hypothetical protein
MMQDGMPARISRSVTVVAALVTLVAGCEHPSTPSVSAPDDSGAGPLGGIHVAANGVDLRLSGATAHLDSTGSGDLSMTVENSGSVAEHLDMVGTSDGGRGTLTGGSGTGSGAMATSGIQILPGGKAGFGAGRGPRIHLTRVHGVTAHGTLPIVLEFGVAGLVRLQARVSHG